MGKETIKNSAVKGLEEPPDIRLVFLRPCPPTHPPLHPPPTPNTKIRMNYRLKRSKKVSKESIKNS